MNVTNPVRFTTSQVNRMLGIAGWVYFVRCVDLDVIKIGWSEDPLQRLETLRSGTPHPLEMITAGAGSKRDEAFLHKRYHEFRISGEWFRFAPRLRRYVGDVLRQNGPQPWPDPIRFTRDEYLLDRAVRNEKAMYIVNVEDECARCLPPPAWLPHLKPRVWPHGPRGPRKRPEKPAQADPAEVGQVAVP